MALAADAGEVDLVVGIEARGFLAGMITAQRLGVGFVAARKPGKLPGPIETVSYDLEYGSDTLEMQLGAVAAGQRVLIVDDVIATGGTMAAAAQLVEGSGATVSSIRSIIEFDNLGARARLAGHDIISLWQVAG